MILAVLTALTALHVEHAPVIDGKLDESAWASAAAGDGFTVRFPDEGAAAHEATEVRVLYDDDALYVGVRAHDDDPHGIRAVMGRRDDASASDWIEVGVDSLADRRTAFVFAVSAAGVERDYKIVDDDRVDDGWNAIWDAGAVIDDQGWTAELRIPLSQLRFAIEDRARWGLQVTRKVARTGEQSTWSPSPRSDPRLVSRYGSLDGLDQLRAPQVLEVVPYVVAGGDWMADADPALRSSLVARHAAGVDARLGLGHGLMLTAAIAPDFGQIEADPAQVNLTGSELFFPERRPFFLEAGELFSADVGEGDTMFYSRRIGAAPHGDGGATAVDADLPIETTILGAAKLSGTTAGGWSVGALDAVGAAAHADVLAEDGTISRDEVEPWTNFAVTRLRKQLGGGAGQIGVIGTATDRVLSTMDERATLHDQAYAGAIDLDWRFADRAWRVFGLAGGSFVGGSADSITRTQRSSVHGWQRPDAPHLHYDPTRTELTGSTATLGLEKVGGGAWTGSIASHVVTPGFEVNDLGFLSTSDAMTHDAKLGYQRELDTGALASYQLDATFSAMNDFEPRLLALGGTVDATATFRDQWDAWASGTIGNDRWDRWATHGGPLLRDDNPGYLSLGFDTDPRRAVQAQLGAWTAQIPAQHTHDYQGWATLIVQPSDSLHVELGSMVSIGDSGRQFVTKVDDRVVIGRLQQVTASATLRVDYTWSPRLSLQLYARPYLSSGRFSDFREVTAPRAARFDDRFTPVGSDLMFSDPSFDARDLQSTMILRWEYRPGSTVLLIWNHDRESWGDDGDFHLGREVSALAGTQGEHVVLLKASYWLDL